MEVDECSGEKYRGTKVHQDLNTGFNAATLERERKTCSPLEIWNPHIEGEQPAPSKRPPAFGVRVQTRQLVTCVVTTVADKAA